MKKRSTEVFGKISPPLKTIRALLVFYMPIRQTIKMSAVKIHCALGLNLFFSFRNLQL